MIKGWWILLLAGCMMSGCVKGPLPEKAAWPWEHAKDYGNNQTGDFITIRGNVANFDKAPKAAKPVKPETLEPPIPDSNPAPETTVAKTQSPLLPTESETGSGKIKGIAKKQYDFTVSDIKSAPPSYLPADSVRTAYDITAFNHGSAPVSVSIGIDPASSQNMATDKTLPFNAVVSPDSDQVLVRIGPKMKSEAYNFRYTNSWNIGDYTAIHNCPEHYRFPFGNNVTAFASVSGNSNTSRYTRYAIIFSMPVGTPVLAARKGTVVQVRTDNIDILHDDSTVATYSHLGKISEGIVAGKTVSTEDVIGEVRTTGDQKEGFIQLTVWRPEPRPVASLKTVSQSAGFDFVSFPLEFCGNGSSECSVLTQDQMVSRNKMTEPRKQGKRKAKSATRKDVNP
jgi:murein DD-endopeptidase MepM/ murein hydrolase activator NlpD